MRARLAAFFMVLIGLSSIATSIHLQSFRVSPENEVLITLDRARCLIDALPQDEAVFGFLPLSKAEGQQFFATEHQERRLLLVRYTLAPRHIDRSAEHDWVIAYYPDHETGLAQISAGAWRVVKDCQNGVFLLSR